MTLDDNKDNREKVKEFAVLNTVILWLLIDCRWSLFSRLGPRGIRCVWLIYAVVDIMLNYIYVCVWIKLIYEGIVSYSIFHYDIDLPSLCNRWGFLLIADSIFIMQIICAIRFGILCFCTLFYGIRFLTHHYLLFQLYVLMWLIVIYAFLYPISMYIFIIISRKTARLCLILLKTRNLYLFKT